MAKIQVAPIDQNRIREAQERARIAIARVRSAPVRTASAGPRVNERPITAKQGEYSRRVGFRAQDLPEFRSEQKDESVTSKIFDFLGRGESTATGFLSEGLAAIRNQKSFGDVIGSALKGAYEGGLGDTRYTAGTLYSQLVDDPYAEKTFSKDVLGQLRGGGSRAVASIAGGIGLDPTTYIPVAGQLKAASQFAGKLPGVGRVTDIAKDAYKTVPLLKGAAETGRGALRMVAPRLGGIDQKFIDAGRKLNRAEASTSEFVAGLSRLYRGEANPRQFEELITRAAPFAKRFGASDEVAAKVADQFKIAKSSIDNLARTGKLDQKTLQRVLTGAQKSADVELLNVVKPIRTIVDEVMTPELVSKGILTAEETAQNAGEYLHRVYAKLGIPVDDTSKIFKSTNAGKIGESELSLTKMSKGNAQRFFEALDNPEVGSQLAGNPAVAALKSEYGQRLSETLGDGVQLATEAGKKKVTAAAKQLENEFSQRIEQAVGSDTFRTLAEEQRAARGLIEDASLVAPLTVLSQARLVEKYSYLDTVDKAFSKVFPSELAAAAEGFTKLPTTEAYGNLAGKYIPQILANDIKGVVEFVKPDKLTKTIEEMTSLWKQATLFSPFNTATTMRNWISNMVLMSMGEKGPDVVSALKQNLRGMVAFEKQDDLYKKAIESGLLDSTFAASEVTSRINKLQRTAGSAEEVGGRVGAALKQSEKLKDSKVGKLLSFEGGRIPYTPVGFGQEGFQAVEAAGKIGLLDWYLKKGYDLPQAAQMVEKSLFNYADLPGGLRNARVAGFDMQTAIPFLSFKYFAGQLAIDTFLNRTYKLGLLPKTKDAVEGFSLDMENNRDLPEYIKQNEYLNVRLPWLSNNGLPTYLDLTYMFPFGDTATGFDAQDIFLGNPFVKTAVELRNNRSFYFDQPIVSGTATPEEAVMQQIGYVGQQFLPRTPLLPGSRQFNKVVDAATGRPDYYGRVQDLPGALADVFGGVKARPIDPNKEATLNRARLNATTDELKAQIKRIGKDRSKSSQQKQSEIRDIQSKITQIRARAQDAGQYPSFPK